MSPKLTAAATAVFFVCATSAFAFVPFEAGAAASSLFAEPGNAPLSAPFDVDAIRAKAGRSDDKNFSCEKPSSPAVDLHFFSMYKKGDDSHSIVDPEADAAYKKAMEPISDFEKKLASMSNRYVLSSPPRPDIAACAMGWLETWAKAGALLGDVNKNGEYTRKWVLGTVSNAYMQVRGEKTLNPEQKKTVENWIHRVATAAKEDFSRGEDMRSRQNNHLYWAAWGVASGAMATHDREMFDWAMEKARFGVEQIDADGSLPLELLRKKRALRYHFYAAMPLFMLAEAGARNGTDLFKYNNQGLKRLGHFDLVNLDHPDELERLTGEKQEMDRAGTSSDLGWLEIYAKHYASDPLAQPALDKYRPMKMSRMGGNITLLYTQKKVDEKDDGKKTAKK
jgi:poly(beta-D-mannuronate) lyase